jgi:hypothetical protein
MASIVVMLAGSAAFTLNVPMAAPAATRAAAPTMNQRWKEPILDESLPDPVFDAPSPYKGRVPYGFSEAAEKFNGRAAMMGFTILFLQELIVGKGVLEQCARRPTLTVAAIQFLLMVLLCSLAHRRPAVRCWRDSDPVGSLRGQRRGPAEYAPDSITFPKCESYSAVLLPEPREQPNM